MKHLIHSVQIGSIALIFGGLLIGCANPPDDTVEQSPIPLEEKVAEAYFHTFPIVENYKAMYAYSILESSPKFVPFNEFAHAAKLYSPEDKFVVSPNNDTFYSTSNLDLRAEPIILKVPEIKDRYYSFQFISMVTDNFAYVGTRTTGNGSAEFAITAPGYNGGLPDGVTEIKAPSDLIALIGRTQVNAEDPDDVQKVMQIQQQYSLEPLSAVYPEYKPTEVNEIEFPDYSPEMMTDERYFKLLNFLLNYIRLSENEEKIIDRYKDIGISPGDPYTFFEENPELQESIISGIKKGINRVDSSARKLGKVVNGWTMFPLGEYFGSNYTARTNIAKIGIYANSPSEAYYPLAFVDSAGNTLSGAHSYSITFPPGALPPARYFWSLTMYDGETQLLTENKIDRYSIGDRTKSLSKSDDGSLTIYLSAKVPEQGTSNWLPSPEGDFNVMMRIYGPEESVLDGSWAPPAIKLLK